MTAPSSIIHDARITRGDPPLTRDLPGPHINANKHFPGSLQNTHGAPPTPQRSANRCATPTTKAKPVAPDFAARTREPACAGTANNNIPPTTATDATNRNHQMGRATKEKATPSPKPRSANDETSSLILNDSPYRALPHCPRPHPSPTRPTDATVQFPPIQSKQRRSPSPLHLARAPPTYVRPLLHRRRRRPGPNVSALKAALTSPTLSSTRDDSRRC
jgi:hypothetical protein